MTWLWVLIGVAGAAGVWLFCYCQNNLLVTTCVSTHSSKIRRVIRIVQLSDLHSKVFGRNNQRLLARIAREQPDFIAITGDIVGRYAKGFESAAYLADKLCKLAPVYYVPGNHEYGREDREELFEALRCAGVRVLRHQWCELSLQGQKLLLLGLDEMGYRLRTPQTLREFSDKQGYKIVLSHFPQLCSEAYCHYDVDMVLSGHAHGGQFILPWIGGVYAPGQGLRPKYYKGKYQLGRVALIVSRGLGNSGFPLRLFNPPDIVEIEIKPRSA